MTVTARMIGALTIWVVFGVVAALWDAGLWTAWGIMLAALAAVDALAGVRQRGIEIERRMPSTLALGESTTVRLRLRGAGVRTVMVVVHDHHPEALVTSDLPVAARVLGGQWTEIAYVVRAIERGQHNFGEVAYRMRSPLGLWWRQRSAATTEQIRVFPNFRSVAKYALAARENRLHELGIHKQRRRGEGTDFHHLREYRPGDPLRQIDWRATSRLNKAISREYDDERDQQVVFVLDHGRRMHSKDGDLSHLDHALNAVLLLSYVALRQGDAVGLLTFGGEPRWLAPRKGPSNINIIQNAVFDLETTLVAPDIQAVVEDLTRRVAKRSLIVLISNIRDDSGDEFLPVLKLARRRHIVLLASLRECILSEVQARPVTDHDSALTVAATHEYLASREAAHRRLENSGISLLDVEPHHLSASLVSRYLAIKSAGLL